MENNSSNHSINMENKHDNVERSSKKRKGKKHYATKRISEKELLGMYFSEEGRSIMHACDDEYLKTPHFVPQCPPNQRKTEQKYTIPKNKHQQKYVNYLKNSERKIIVATGPAGTGKTLFATEYGIRGFLQGNYDKLLFTRPSVSVDEDLGYLPGTLEEKMAPWVRPIFDVLYSFISPLEVKQHIENKTIEIAPLGFMRGRTFKNAWIVADEMQNSTVSQMKMLLTRLGKNSRLVVTGDLEQHDFNHEMNGLADFLNKFRGRSSSNISNVEFEIEDVEREEVVKEILEIYSSGVVPHDYLETEQSESSSSKESGSQTESETGSETETENEQI